MPRVWRANRRDTLALCRVLFRNTRAPLGAPQRCQYGVRATLSERGPATPVSQLLAPGLSAREWSPVAAREPRLRLARPAGTASAPVILTPHDGALGWSGRWDNRPSNRNVNSPNAMIFLLRCRATALVPHGEEARSAVSNHEAALGPPHPSRRGLRPLLRMRRSDAAAYAAWTTKLRVTDPSRLGAIAPSTSG